MTKIWQLAIGFQNWGARHGQNLIEYAMIVTFLLVASSVLVPNLQHDMSAVIHKIQSVWTAHS